MNSLELEINRAGKLFLDREQFRTRLGKPPLLSFYCKVSLPLLIAKYIDTHDDEGKRRPLKVREIHKSFSKDFFNHLKRSINNGEYPPILLDFNCIHCHTNGFRLKCHLGNTSGKFIRFYNPNDEHEYLGSNILSHKELLEFMDPWGVYDRETTTPIPTFEAFMQTVRLATAVDNAKIKRITKVKLIEAMCCP